VQFTFDEQTFFSMDRGSVMGSVVLGGCSGIMDRIFDFIPVAVSDDFGRDEQQLQPCDTDRMGHHALQEAFFMVGQAFSGNHFNMALEFVGQHDDLKK